MGYFCITKVLKQTGLGQGQPFEDLLTNFFIVFTIALALPFDYG